MDPVTISTVALGVSTGMNTLGNLINGRKGRQLQRELHNENRADSERRFGVDMGLRREDLDLRRMHFVWNVEEAQRQLAQRQQERLEEIKRRQVERIEDRAQGALSQVFRGTIEIWSGHDPYASAHPGVRTLRVMVLSGTDPQKRIQSTVETGLSKAISDYGKAGGQYRITNPTGVWAEGQVPGSWPAHQLHALRQDVPALTIRVVPNGEGKVNLMADLMGFPMGDSTFAESIMIGELPEDHNQITTAVQLITLMASDTYHLSQHGEMPVLPHILGQFLSDAANKPAVLGIMNSVVSGYQKTLLGLLEDSPELAVPIAVTLAESLSDMQDKSFALQHLKFIEDLTKTILPQHPVLRDKLAELYTKVGVPEDAARIKAISPATSIATPAANTNLLEQHL